MPARLLLGIAPHDRVDARLDQLLKVAHDTSPDGVLVVDARERIASYNRRFVRMWGIPRNIVRTRSDRKALQAVLKKLVDPQGFVARVDYLYKKRRERSREEIALKDGRIFERHSAPIFSTNGEYFGRVWYFRDITERRRAEVRLRDDARLKQHQEFLANVSHDLQTPLTAIEGFTETLLNGALDDARNRKRFLRTIIAQSRRLRLLVDGLLDSSHIEAAPGRAEATPLEFSKFMRGFVAGMQPIFLRKRVRLRLSIDAGLHVAIDEAQLSRVMGNLLDNAVKYSKQGGRVLVTASRSGRSALVLVEDRGIGISPQDIPKTFDRFHRTEAARRHGIPGHGLGLFLVKRLVELAGGRISVESREGRGSTFRFTRPLDAPVRKR